MCCEEEGSCQGTNRVRQSCKGQNGVSQSCRRKSEAEGGEKESMLCGAARGKGTEKRHDSDKTMK